MAHCRVCGADIDWIETAGGKSTPVNPAYIEVDPHPLGNTKIYTDSGKVVTGIKLKDQGGLFPPGSVIRGRVSHFSTCPYAGNFRRKD